MQNNDILENLISLYGNDVLRIATAYTHNISIAEDIFQEVFIKVALNIDKFEKRSSEKTWIIRITINTCKDYLKSSWNKKVIPLEHIETTSNNYEEKMLKEENSNIIIQEILKLPLKYKEILLLYYYQDLLTSDIAKILNIPEASVRTRLRRAREIIKNNLKIALED